jgi:hypothetical protein
MDTNVIGRFRILDVEEPESPKVKYLIVGDLSKESRGNALGMGSRTSPHSDCWSRLIAKR